MPDSLAQLQSALADRYTIERELGAGGMATVYLAQDHKLGRMVALKVLRPELAAALGGDRFLREIEIAAKLAHPHILGLYDCGDADGLLYYTMPFVEGESLRDRLTREKQLSLDDALQIAREVADALGYAHALGLVHRDIKPENILFEAGHAVVADFGIAKAIAAAGSERLTETGLAIGTPAYMSPEQAAGSQDLDGRSDLYSLGCVLYEMLSGDPPFYASTPQAVLAKKLSEPLPRISVVREAVPAGIEAALSKALARTPADRFGTAAQFVEALTHPEAMGAALMARRPAWWRRRAVRFAAVVLVVIAGAVLVGRWLRPGAAASHRPRTAIAVLPLENLSAEGAQAYFAPGLQDELLTQLSKVAALTVISRTSVIGYARTTKPIREIADELAVGTIVEGSVQVVGNRLRVNVQLIDAATDRHLWAEQYDRTLDDAFAVQSEIAQRIVEVVGARLTRAEAGAIAAAPTANPEAYRLYLQGEEYRRRPGYDRRNFEAAQRLYESALALDSGFALAHAMLGHLHGMMYGFRIDPYPARAALMRGEAETALRLAPDLPQAHSAMALAIMWGQNDFRRGLAELMIAAQGLPGSGELWMLIGAFYRGIGESERALSAFEKAVELDPRNTQTFVELALTYQILRRFGDAEAAYDRAIALGPDVSDYRVDRAMLDARWRGRLDAMRSLVAAQGCGKPDLQYLCACLALWQRTPDSILALFPRPERVIFEWQSGYIPALLYVAWAHQMRGDSAAARSAFAGALRQLDSALQRLPGDWRFHASRGIALAGVGRRVEARHEAEWIGNSDLYRIFGAGIIMKSAQARIFAQAGMAGEAVGKLEFLISVGEETVHSLQFDPRWDPIRSDPRFQALLKSYGQ